MNETTRRYLEGRFADYYRKIDFTYPPEPHRREFAYIPWTDSDETIMVRHKSNHDLGNLETFLMEKPPQHMYYSAAYYNDPGRRGGMSKKEWQKADLIFDIDCDHLPDTDSDMSLKKALDHSKEHVIRLVELLEEDFNFNNITIVFSGNRGYHVHVRDNNITELESTEREEIAKYVKANGLDIPNLIRKSYRDGSITREVKIKGGWGKHLFNSFIDHLKTITTDQDNSPIEFLTNYDQIGEGRAKTIVNLVNNDEIDHTDPKNIAENVATRKTFIKYAAEKIDELSVEIDSPVTTDTHRLIRLPHSLHGGSGLMTTQIPKNQLKEFSPLDDAIPDRYTTQEITIESDQAQEIYLNGDNHTIQKGENKVTECVGIHLMTQNKAEKKPLI